MKLFNFKYFKENIKKSKGLLAFVLGIVPLLNIVMLAICISEEQSLINFNLISIITLIGLYFVPIVLALSLFGFVFKRKSVDFVMSKPISRQNLYFTNMLGGILVILAFMLLNTLIFSFFSLFFSNIIIPFALLIDYFIFWLISYIFMFAVATLAITLAGNFMSSMVIMMIIICLYPFLIISSSYLSMNNNNYIKCTESTCAPKNYTCGSDKECQTRLLNNEYNLSYDKSPNVVLTAPTLIMFAGETTIYNTGSLIKMLLLSIIYFTIGFFGFKKRKMENNETSFKSEFIHYLVKTITLIPVTFIAYIITREGGFIGLIVSIVAVFIYYNIYDLITRKEIYKFIKSCLICFLTFSLIFGTYLLTDYLKSHQKLVIDNITSISLDYFNGTYYETLVISDTKTINELLKENISSDNKINYNFFRAYLYSGNKKYSTNLMLSNDALKIIKEYYLTRQNEKIASFNYDGIDYIDNMPVTKELKKLIKETMQDNNISNDNNPSLTIYDYKNHNYEVLLVPYTKNTHLLKYIQNYENTKLLNLIAKESTNLSFYLEFTSEEFNEEEDYVFDYVIRENIDEFANYIKNKNNGDNPSDSLIISVYGSNNHKFHIYDVTTFKEEFKRYQEKLKNDSNYLNMLENFKDMSHEY